MASRKTGLKFELSFHNLIKLSSSHAYNATLFYFLPFFLIANLIFALSIALIFILNYFKQFSLAVLSTFNVLLP